MKFLNLLFVSFATNILRASAGRTHVRVYEKVSTFVEEEKEALYRGLFGEGQEHSMSFPMMPTMNPASLIPQESEVPSSSGSPEPSISPTSTIFPDSLEPSASPSNGSTIVTDSLPPSATIPPDEGAFPASTRSQMDKVQDGAVAPSSSTALSSGVRTGLVVGISLLALTLL